MAAISTVDDFSAHVQSSFRLSHEAEEIELILEEVSGLTSDPTNIESFTLLFRTPGGELFPQATYALDHDVLGRQVFFLVPIDQDEGGVYYEAVFNRKKRSKPTK